MKQFIILSFIFLLIAGINQNVYAQQNNCNGPFDVDLSSNTTHSIEEVLQQLGLTTIEQLCSLQPQFNMVLGGTLELNNSGKEICFKGVEIKMLSESTIRVENNTKLNLNNVNIYGCSAMWQGIFVENSQLKAENCKIEDAHSGVFSSSNCQLDFQSIIFKNNFCGLNLGDTEIEDNYISLSISDCEFFTDQNFLGSNHDLITGIKLIHLGYMDLSPKKGESNNFHDLNCGIFAYSTSIRVDHSYFEDILNSTVSFYGAGISLHNFYGQDNWTSIIRHNNFNNMSTAIKSYRGNINSQSNYIYGVNEGIIVKRAQIISISNNYISSSFTGVEVNSCTQQYSIFSINNNTIKVNNHYDAKAINVQHTPGLSIKENELFLNDAGYGIFVNESSGVTVFDNIINVNGEWQINIDAIHMESSSGYDISYNNLKQDDAAVCCPPPYGRGVYSESSHGFIGCNNVNGFSKAGVKFMDICDNSRLDGNTLANSKDLVLGDEEIITFIGKQGDFTNKKGWGNRWTGDLGGSAYNYSPFDYVKYSQFLVNAFSNPDYKPVTIVAASNDWFRNRPDVINESTCTLLPHEEDHEVGPEDFDCTDFINKIISIDTSRAVDDCKKAIWKYHYFKKLLIMKKLNLLTSECLSFFNRYNDNILVKIAKVDSAVTNILINQSSDSLLYENMNGTQYDLNELHDQGLVFTPQYQQTMTLYNQLLEDHSVLMQSERVDDNRKADSVKTVISTISISDTCLSLLLRTYDIELDFIKSDSLTPFQLTQVRGISELCPYVYGDGVYLARALRSIYENVMYESIEDCAPERLIPRSIENNSIGEEMQLYPNPATDELNISLNQNGESSGKVLIYNMTGNTISEYYVQDSELKINTSSYRSGIYFVKYISDSGIEIVEKLVILK